MGERLDYEAPQRQTAEPKNYGGCLIPIGVAVMMIAVLIYIMDAPHGPTETRRAVTKLGILFTVSAVLFVTGGISLKRRRKL